MLICILPCYDMLHKLLIDLPKEIYTATALYAFIFCLFILVLVTYPFLLLYHHRSPQYTKTICFVNKPLKTLFAPTISRNITRFTVHLDTKSVDMDLLHEQDKGTWIEFCQINWKYAAKHKYRHVHL